MCGFFFFNLLFEIAGGRIQDSGSQRFSPTAQEKMS